MAHHHHKVDSTLSKAEVNLVARACLAFGSSEDICVAMNRLDEIMVDGDRARLNPQWIDTIVDALEEFALNGHASLYVCAMVARKATKWSR